MLPFLSLGAAEAGWEPAPFCTASSRMWSQYGSLKKGKVQVHSTLLGQGGAHLLPPSLPATQGLQGRPAPRSCTRFALERRVRQAAWQSRADTNDGAVSPWRSTLHVQKTCFSPSKTQQAVTAELGI